jgi:acyl-CoA hydrolase
MKPLSFSNQVLVKPEDLNPANTLFGGRLLQWLDEKAALYCYCQMEHSAPLVTKFVSEINFVHPAKSGDILSFGFRITSIGRTSITLECSVKNVTSGQTVLHVQDFVFVSVNNQTRLSEPHNLILDNDGNVIKKQ